MEQPAATPSYTVSPAGQRLKGDPDSPVIFHLRLGDGLAPKVIEHEPAPDALGVPLVAISVQGDAE